MKKVILSLLTIVTLTMVCSFKTVDNPNSASMVPEGVEMGRKCSCGGNMEWHACAYYVNEKCRSCNGTGVLKSGNYQTTCTMCKGTGKVSMPKSGYVCKSCGRIEKD